MKNRYCPLVAIILVNYNGFDDTVACIQSLEKIDYPNYEIYVVDNGSDQHPTEQQMVVLERTIYIALKDNLGFSGGNNIGIRRAMEDSYEYFLLLNNDTIVTPDFLTRLVTTAQAHPEAGCITGRIMFYFDQDKIWYAGGTYNERYTSVCHKHWGETFSSDISEKCVVETEFATGCLMLLTRSVVETVGLLSEEYFLYAEDTDYCLRLHQNNYPILYDERSVILHKISRSTGATSANTQYYMMRNRLMIIRKYSKQTSVAYRKILMDALKDIIKGRRMFSPVIWGIFDFLMKKRGKNLHDF